jgi:hypothetical protein
VKDRIAVRKLDGGAARYCHDARCERFAFLTDLVAGDRQHAAVRRVLQ